MKNTPRLLLAILATVVLIILAIRFAPQTPAPVAPIETASTPAAKGNAIAIAPPKNSAPLSALNSTAESAALSPVSPDSHEALARLGQTVLKKLPKNSDLRGLTNEDVHQIAKPVFAGALQLKLYADHLQAAMKQAEPDALEYQQFAAQGADFYGRCAAGNDTPDSIKAVCYVEFAKLSQKSGHPENISKIHPSSEVMRIARSISG